MDTVTGPEQHATVRQLREHQAVVNSAVRTAATATGVPLRLLHTDTAEPASLRYVDGRLMQCKDLPDEVFVNAVRCTPGVSVSDWRMAWDVQDTLEALVGPVPRNLFFAKARRLVARGLIGGCPCGCRGDFHLPEECITPDRCCRLTAPELTVVS